MNFICKNISQKNQSKRYMKNVIDYSLRENKMIKTSFISFDFSSDNSERIYKMMNTTKKVFGKTTDKQIFHYTISFEKKLSEEEMKKSKELVMGFLQYEKFKNYESYAVAHDDNKQTHYHIVFNSVNYETGKN